MVTSDLRTHFPHTQNQTYVNHAAVSPISRPVQMAIEEYIAERQGATENDRIANFSSMQALVEETKERAAQVLGAAPSQVEFVPNTSTGLNILCHGLDWEAGDRVSIPDGSFPTNVYPFLNLQSEGVSVDFVPTVEGAYTIEDIEKTLRPETRVLSVSWVHFLSGFRPNLGEIGELCDAHDVLFCVDAIQGLGALEIDVENAGIDFLSAGGHKWLMAIQGIGLLYCDDELQKHIRPPSGWLHGPVDWKNLSQYELTFHEDARRFRTGTFNNVGIAALHAALGLYLECGPAWCEERVLELSGTLADELRDRGIRVYGDETAAHRSGIVSIVPEEPDRLFDYLEAHNIIAAMRNRKIRFSPTYYNDESDLHAILSALDAFQ